MTNAIVGGLLGVLVGTIAGLIPETRAILKESFLHPTRDAVLIFRDRKVEVRPIPRVQHSG